MARATEEDCITVVTRCVLAARAMLDIDIPAVLAEIEHYDSFAPFFDPTGWLKSRELSQEKRALLEAALPLWKWAQQQKEKTKQEEHGAAE
jgi:hypothetical protein